MTARERFVNTMTFRPTDRCFLKPDNFSPLAIKRWEKEGLPAGCDPNVYFGMDPREFIRVNMECCPGLPEQILEDDGEYVVKINADGITLKQRKDDPLCAMPHFIGWPVSTRKDFERLREQYQPRIAERYPRNYEQKKDFRNNHCEAPVAYEFRGMFFHRLRMWMGLEGLAMAMYDDPDWICEMVAFLEEFLTAVSAKVLAEMKLSYVYACDDIAYKTSSLISPALFHKFFFEPVRRMVERVRRAGVPVIVMDSDGNLDEFAEIYRQTGFNASAPSKWPPGMTCWRCVRAWARPWLCRAGSTSACWPRGKRRFAGKSCASTRA